MRYDVVVIGAGAAGAPLAARLSDDPDRSVLLVEAGEDCARTDEFPAELLDAGRLVGAMPGHPQNWSFLANLTPDLPYTVARGKILGGSTTLNGTYYVRGRRADFDRWAAQGNPEWSYDKVLPFFRAAENDLDYGDRAMHGADGPLPVRRALADPHVITKAFAAACAELGYPEEHDKNADGAPGVGPLPTNALDGVRINTGIAFVNPVRERPNFTVLGSTLARRIVFEGTRARGVEVERNARTEFIEADEIVLSAGAIKSPHLLALSGIGPRLELEAAGIDVLVDLPGVGKDFSDHPDIAIHWVPVRGLEAGDQRVPFESILNFAASGSTYDDLEILPHLKSLGAILGTAPTKGGLAGMMRRPLHTLRALRGVSRRRLVQQVAHQGELALGVSVQIADARGSVTTVSHDAHVQPRIDYRYLDNESDLRRMREGARTAVAILRTEAFRPLVKRLGELDDRTLGDDALLNAWLRAHLSTAIHACGTCKMGADPARGAVVDQYGRVHGVSGLRVADSSILPTTPSRGPAATTIMIGLRMAELMSRDGVAGTTGARGAS